MTPLELRKRVRIPVIAAPMFLVSGPDLVIAACRSGVVGSFPAMNARTAEELDDWLARITEALGGDAGAAPFAVNLIVRSERSERFASDLDAVCRYCPDIVITSVGPPNAVVELVHGYGGLVFHDVASMRHARKAAEAGVDGLILLTAGAGGHCGSLNGMAFVPQVRAFFGGLILLAGGIGDGRAVRAAEMLGADYAYCGTRFAATQESMASQAYKALLVSETPADIITTDRISGMPATFLRRSIEAVGLDPDDLPPRKALLTPSLPRDIKAWRDIWSAGHGVGLIHDIPQAAVLVQRMACEYAAATGMA